MAFQPSISSNEAELLLKDPVCCMTVTPQSPHMLQHEGKPIYYLLREGRIVAMAGDRINDALGAGQGR